MRHRLRRWWNIPTIWPLCFAILFDHDIVHIDFGRSFDLYSLLETFSVNNKTAVVYPQIMPVIVSMIQNGLKTVVKDQEDPDSPLSHRNEEDDKSEKPTGKRPKHIRRRSMSLNTELSSQRMYGCAHFSEEANASQKTMAPWTSGSESMPVFSIPYLISSPIFILNLWLSGILQSHPLTYKSYYSYYFLLLSVQMLSARRQS